MKSRSRRVQFGEITFSSVQSLLRHLRLSRSSSGSRSVVEPYSAKDLQQKSEENWARVEDWKKAKCVLYLRQELHPEDIKDLAQEFAKLETTGEDVGDPFFHFGTGMAIRNMLRDVVKDDELPPVRYESGPDMQNWDDFYMAALRQAVAPKDGEV